MNNGSVQTINSGSIANNTTVNSNSSQQILQGGTAAGTTVNTGGSVIASEGANLGNVYINGGNVKLALGTNANGIFDFGPQGGMLQFESASSGESLSNTGSVNNHIVNVVVNDIGNGGNIDFTFMKYSSTSHATVINSNVLAVTGDNGAFALTLTGKSNADFDVVNDGLGGVMVEAHTAHSSQDTNAVAVTGNSPDAYSMSTII